MARYLSVSIKLNKIRTNKTLVLLKIKAQIRNMKEHYEQTLKNLAELLVTPERYGRVAVQLAFEEIPDAQT